MKKMAISLSTFPIYYLTFIIDFIENLANTYQIDLFLHNSGEKIPCFGFNVKCFSYQKKIKRFHAIDQFFGTKTLIDLKKHSFKQYDVIIGIESLGLCMADVLCQNNHAKLIYYNFEIYDNKNNRGVWSHNFNIIKNKEKRVLENKVDLFIIQDKDRESAYKRILHVYKKIDTLFLPVSVRQKANLFSDKNMEKIHVLYYGQLSLKRFNEEMIRQAQLFNENIYLTIKSAYYKNSYLTYLKNLDTNNKVTFDLTILDNDEVSKTISQFHIGLVFYKDDNLNEKLTGHSSVKTAHYMQSAIPIICFKSTSLRKVIAKYDNGIAINHIAELNQAIQAIKDDYVFYQKNAQKAFKNLYSIEPHMKKLRHIL